MNIASSENIEKYSKLDADGVGLFRCEYLILKLGEHPLKLVREERGFDYVYALKIGLEKVAKAFYPRPVVFRTSDLKSNEHKHLEGGELYESEEENPMLGLRGCSRYLNKKFSKIFDLELTAVKELRDDKLTNIWMMFPFVRKVEELKKLNKIIKKKGLKRNSFKLWMMLETPAMMFQLDKLKKLCDGISIGGNDLYSLLFGTERDNDALADMGYLKENTEEFKKILKIIIDTAHRNELTVSFCGDAVSKYPDLAKFLVKVHIDSISVNPPAFKKIVSVIRK